ncbi:galactokinase [Paenibacillus selenitireducens]|uniref:Galactokinase n=1 Tax=Paenibacillus selenitireducens TaxID=1324314 RepID=A0A1T2XKW2_9BACL|nr:galactokinase [Paenibacillus selenitireducens]OPA80445.1 galactokinase [Paenibacillus selenitireducens]
MSNTLHETLQSSFLQYYGPSDQPLFWFHAPGRVNLIGEHIDYNGGFVFPAALQFGTTLVIRPRTDRKIVMRSTNFDGVGEISLDELPAVKSDAWTDYPTGVVVTLQQAGYPVTHGYELLFHGEIPNGSGLSSSASIEVVTMYALLTLEGHPTDRKEIAVLSQKVENQFVGVNSGIMDQFAVANGRQDHAILLNCDTLEEKLVPFQAGPYKLVIGNTKKRRGLVDSKYNERRQECDEAVAVLAQHVPGLKLLCELSTPAFEQFAHHITNETVRNRARHAIAENDRVLKSVDYLENNDLVNFGLLMQASHTSLRDLYEVSCFELDVMVEEALNVPGVLGARMTGAGFGGCTVSLVHEDQVEQFIQQVGKVYEEKTGIHADFYVCDVGNGVEQLNA